MSKNIGQVSVSAGDVADLAIEGIKAIDAIIGDNWKTYKADEIKKIKEFENRKPIVIKMWEEIGLINKISRKPCVDNESEYCDLAYKDQREFYEDIILVAKHRPDTIIEMTLSDYATLLSFGDEDED